jgi:predicted lysophospholipase L1 biosynthesis ABC-type transport system permease subunit
MKENQDYLKDIAEIRSMMERSSKFLSLSGWAGIMAGMYALAGAYVAQFVIGFQPTQISFEYSGFTNLTLLAIGILFVSLVSAILFSRKKAADKGEEIWNSTSKLADL